MPVGQLWGYSHPCSLSDVHPGHSFVETLDDLSCAYLELEGLSSISGAVKLLPGGEAANVVNADHVSWLNMRSLSLSYSLDLHRLGWIYKSLQDSPI